MWWIDFLKNGFSDPGPLLPFLLFRILFAVCCLLKFTTETRRGYFSHFKPHTYLYFSYRMQKPRFLIRPTLYRIVYLLKIPAALLLLLGIASRTSLMVLLLSLLLEMRIYFKYHANLLFLIGCLLLLSSELGKELSLHAWLSHSMDMSKTIRAAALARGDLFPQFLILITVCFVYFGTAVRKLNPVFLRGAVVYLTLEFTLSQRHLRKHRDAVFPSSFIDGWIKADEATLQKCWRPFMYLTVFMELVLPILLSVDSTRGVAMAVGIIMHIGFTVMYPATLLHFSLLMISSYILFSNPQELTHWVALYLGQ